MTLRNVPKAHTLEQQRQEINLIAADLNTAADGVQTFGGNKIFTGTNINFQGPSTVITYDLDVSNELNVTNNAAFASNVTCLGTIQGVSLVKQGGLSTEFLKADGSVDSNTYLTTVSTATTSALGLVQPDGTTITIDANGVITGANTYTLPTSSTTVLGGVKVDGTTISIDGNGVVSAAAGGDPFTANGFKFGVNEGSDPTGSTAGEFRQIGGIPHFYDGTAWREFILGNTAVTTIPGETAWDKVLLRSTYDSDFNDVKYNATGDENYYTTYGGSSVGASTLVASPVKFGTKALKSVGNGVKYPHRSDYDFTGEWTIEFWIYFDSFATGGNGKHVLVSKCSTSVNNGSWKFYVKADANNNRYFQFEFYDDQNSQLQNRLLHGESGAGFGLYWMNQWNHVALTRDSNGALHFYKHGTENALTTGGATFANDIANNSHDLMIGGSLESNPVNELVDYFMDDVRITKDVRYTSIGTNGTPAFTAPTSAHPISGSTTIFNPPPTEKTGVLTLGTTPSWRGTLGVSVSQQSSGNYRLTFANAFANADDYYVFSNVMDYASNTGVYTVINRSTTHIDLILYREGDGNNVDQGSVSIQVLKH